MSFVSAVRDYVEFLNTVSSNITTTNFISETFFYLLKTLQYTFYYVISFQWIRDFTLLPILVPQVTNSILKESFFLETPSKVFFDFLEIPSIEQNKLLLGFFNSFFLTLPISITHIISIRRLLIQGIPAGAVSIAGYLVGQILFFSCVIFGFRSIVIPWLTLEPLNYLLGLFLVFRIIYSMTRENLVELKDFNNPTIRKKFQNFFLTSFILAWCEQSSIFQFLGNLTLSPTPTIIEGFSGNTTLVNFLNHTNYILGISIGSIIWTLFWGFAILTLKKWVWYFTPSGRSKFMQTINRGSFVLALAFCLSSIPFYGFDYLFAGPLGFVSQDRTFKNTLFDQYNIQDPYKLVGLGRELQHKGLVFDVSVFDRGRYLVIPKAKQEFVNFEDLNYRGETDWMLRYKKEKIGGKRKSFQLTLSKIFKKQKPTQPKDKSVLTSVFEDSNKLLMDETAPVFMENTGSRFSDWYDFKTTTKDDQIKTGFEKITNSSFSNAFLVNGTKSIERKVKNKYYSNPIYKTLLKLDIDLLINRQPSRFQLTGNQEIDLFTKRQILMNYTDSLRDYSKLPYSESFEEFFDGSKSFSNKVYNQQFKGTLNPLRRLFYLTSSQHSDELENSVSKNKQILKFDQPLYQLTKSDEFSSRHEELDETLTKQKNLLNKNVLTRPLYAGWDENLRKFVITNKMLPRDYAGYKIKLNQALTNTFKSDHNKSSSPKSTLTFTKWPLAENILRTPKTKSKVSSVTLYELRENISTPEIQGWQDFDTFPSNVEIYNRTLKPISDQPTNQPRNLFDSLAPKRGGFIWPGDEQLSDQIKKLFKLSR